MLKRDNFFIAKTTKDKLPRLPFKQIKNDILSKKYTLSLVFIGDARSKTLNKKYRKKNMPANILSFSLSKNEGEIYINVRQAPRESKLFNMNTKQFVGYLFIHGLLHLKGCQHSSTMNREETKLTKKFLNVILPEK